MISDEILDLISREELEAIYKRHNLEFDPNDIYRYADLTETFGADYSSFSKL